MENKAQDGNPRLTRREFLKVFAGAAVAVAIFGPTFGPKMWAYFSGQAKEESKEKLKPSSGVVIVDFAPENPSEYADQTKFPNNEDLAKKLLGDKFKTSEEIDNEFDTAQTMESEEGLRKVMQTHPELAIFYAYIKQFGNHGEQVAKAMRASWEHRGKNKKPFIEPLQDAVDLQNIHFLKDEYGNIGVEITLLPEKIIEMLKKVRADQTKVINLSLQLGTMAFWKNPQENPYPNQPVRLSLSNPDGKRVYFVHNKGQGVWGKEITGQDGNITKYILPDGTEIFPMEEKTADETLERLSSEYKQTPEGKNPGNRIEDAYTRDKQQNVLLLNQIATAFPDIVVVAAAGNNHDDFREVAPQLDNRVLTVGEWVTKDDWTNRNNRPANEVFGAQIYVDNSEFEEVGHGSSISTAIISALADSLIEKGVSSNEVREKILKEYCRQETYTDTNGKVETTHVLDFAKYKQ